MPISIDSYLRDRDFSSDNPNLYEIVSASERINDLNERLEGLTGTERLYVKGQLQTNYRKLGANLTNAIRWEKKQEVTPVYKSYLITFETPKGQRGYNRWIHTHVEVWGELVNYPDDLPSDTVVEDKILNSIALDPQWDWILNMGLTFAIEEEYEVDETPYDHIKVTIKRLIDYVRVNRWNILY